MEQEQEGLKNSGVRLNQASQNLEVCREKMAVLKQLWNKKPLWEKFLAEDEAAKKKVVKSVSDYQEMSRRYDSLYEQFIASQAGLMAQKLVEGEPCPVCGAVHHPAPCLNGNMEEIVDRSRVDEAKADREMAEKAVEKSRLQCQRLAEAGAELKSGILHDAGALISDVAELFEGEGFWTTVYDMGRACRRALEAAKGQWQQAQDACERFEANGEKLKKLQKEQDALHMDYIKLVQQKAVLSSEKKSRTDSLAAMKSKMSFTSQTEAEQRLSNLKREMEQLKKALDKAEADLETWTGRQHLKQGQFGERQQMLKQTEMELAQAKAKYSALLEISGWPPETEYGVLEAKREALAGQEKDVYAVRQTNLKIYERLERLLADYGEEQENFARIRHLSRIANGQMAGMVRIDFQTYMQRRYFEQMVDAANRRLAGMSGHQFLLECRELENLGRQGEAGLDLDVYSLINDSVRDVKTLSGGESFMAALALALGMADVIQQEAGKIHVDTLFIDEGFGSLDENARNQAIRILNELAGNDRLVGIISHVSELKEQIEQKIVVTKTNKGSSISM